MNCHFFYKYFIIISLKTSKDLFVQIKTTKVDKRGTEEILEMGFISGVLLCLLEFQILRISRILLAKKCLHSVLG